MELDRMLKSPIDLALRLFVITANTFLYDKIEYFSP